MGVEFVCLSGERFFVPIFFKPYAKGLGKVAMLSLQGLGGAIGESSPDLITQYAMLKWLERRYSNVEGLVSPYPCLEETRLGRKGPYYTHVILLKENIDEQLKKRVRKKQKQSLRQANKAERIGVTVRPGTGRDWERYFTLYQLSQKRWGQTTQAYPLQTFKKIARCQADYPVMWVAEYEKKVVAGMLCFMHQKHACYWHGVAHHDYFYTGANTLLHHQIMALETISWYDLNASAGLDSVERFKESLGAVPLPLWKFTRHAFFFQNYQHFRA